MTHCCCSFCFASLPARWLWLDSRCLAILSQDLSNRCGGDWSCTWHCLLDMPLLDLDKLYLAFCPGLEMIARHAKDVMFWDSDCIHSVNMPHNLIRNLHHPQVKCHLPDPLTIAGHSLSTFWNESAGYLVWLAMLRYQPIPQQLLESDLEPGRRCTSKRLDPSKRAEDMSPEKAFVCQPSES